MYRAGGINIMDQLSRRKFITRSLKGTAGVLAVAMVPIGLRRLYDDQGEPNSFEVSGSEWQATGETPLPIPPLLKNESTDVKKAVFHLTAQTSQKEFIKGKGTET